MLHWIEIKCGLAFDCVTIKLSANLSKYSPEGTKCSQYTSVVSIVLYKG
jgi:hypothetical protein